MTYLSSVRNDIQRGDRGKEGKTWERERKGEEERKGERKNKRSKREEAGEEKSGIEHACAKGRP